MIEITSRVEDNAYLIIIDGDVDASSSIYLDKAITLAIEEDYKNILIDCTKLNYISSAGLGVFMSYIQDFEARQINLVIFGLSEKVQNVFQILGLDQLLQIVASEEKAKLVINDL
ncbi:MAG: STAS domain-containing protein [Bacteroidota bacterium]|jgi:anti-sigma B factor antagonist|nr:STAS domain-containing protein [Bacteroidota bacterium]